MRKKKIIPFRQTLFWDVNPKNINPQKHAVYIIERILDFGNEKEVRWMFHYYSPRLIKKVVDTSRVVDVKSRSLWSLIYA